MAQMIHHNLSPMFWISLIILIPTLLWTIKRHRNPSLNRVLFLTAHPDDESMFFGPTILNTRASLLCLSNGNADGLGSKRELELEQSAQLLNVKNLKIVNDPELQDSMSKVWNASKVLEHLKDLDQYDALVTFDEYGISGHKNHQSLYFAVLEAKRQDKIKIPCFKLVSVPVMQKFSGLFEALWTATVSDRMVFFATPQDYLLSVRAMFCHRSQLVWFRYLYLLFSRYMIINELEEIV
ncbi:putative N-acetylglucosaminyl-phosphatidylinositol-deacetylase [Gorgonomyces haynaldii]|nr:putative N-acetylglucosaminyl-phosphatidylinositol-deacetylase [Gorgonomyces haynaldii]